MHRYFRSEVGEKSSWEPSSKKRRVGSSSSKLPSNLVCADKPPTMWRSYLDLDNDVLIAILLLVVATAGGATELAKAMAVCKKFEKFAEDKYLLERVNFNDFALPKSIEHCQHTKSLLVKCAEAGNVGAQYKLAQVILMGFSQYLAHEPAYYLEEDRLPRFLSYFKPEQVVSNDSMVRRFTHFELVSLFLSRCSILDHVSMLPYVQIYVRHFDCGNPGYINFYKYFNCKSALIRAIVDVGQKRKIWYSPRLNNSRIEPEMRDAQWVNYRISLRYDHFFRMFRELSQSKWEELKRECHFIEKELLSSECHAKPLDGELKILDTGKRWFYYIAFDGNVTRDIALALDRGWDTLRSGCCFNAAKTYYVWQQQAAFAFDKMFLKKDYV